MLSRALIAVCVAGAHALAQTPPTQDPGLNNAGIADRLLQQQKRRLDTTPIPPVSPRPQQSAIPGYADPTSDFAASARGPMHREGTLLAGLEGRLEQTGDALVFVPRSGRALVLMPSAVLTQIETASASAPGRGVRISGVTYAYREVAYLLPTVFSLDTGVDSPAPAVTPPTDARPPAGDDPAAADVIRSLESRPARPRALERLAPVEPTSPTPPRGAWREGTVLKDRRVRLARSPEGDGRLVALFDNDPDSPAPPPLILLPCRALEVLESRAAWGGDAAAFRLTGRVFEHGGRGYCLPTMVRPIRPGDLRSLQ